MTIAQDTAALLTVWGETVSLMRRGPTFSDRGTPTPVWTSVATPSCDIQSSGGATIRLPSGLQVSTTHNLFFPQGTDVRGGDRVRPAGWVAGNDEYEVQGVLAEPDSHVEAQAILVKGHGG